ncbi:MAG: LysE family transporter [Sedimentisphaerales bacterium]|nr:LysE family transporter [Sedimentisphaerales bacterium]
MALLIFLFKAVGISLSGVMAPGAITAATIAAGSRRRHAGVLIAVGHGIVEFPLMLLIMAALTTMKGEGNVFALSLGSSRLEIPLDWIRIALGLAGGFVLLWMAVGMIRELRQSVHRDELFSPNAASDSRQDAATNGSVKSHGSPRRSEKTTNGSVEPPTETAANCPSRQATRGELPVAASDSRQGAATNGSVEPPTETAANCPSRQATRGGQNPLVIGILLSLGNPYFLLWWATIGLALAAQARAFGVLAFGLFALIHWLCDLVWLEILSYGSFRGARLLGEGGQKIILGICALAVLVFGLWFLADAAHLLYKLHLAS